jgi:hypothetical protein
VSTPVDVIVREYAAPVLAAAGFRRSGRVFRLDGERGDAAVLEIAPFVLSSGSRFSATGGVIVTPYADFIDRALGDIPRRRPGPSSALVELPVLPPREWWQGVGQEPREDPQWGFTDDADVPACGRAFAAVLAEDVIPVLVRLLDRTRLLAEMRERTTPDLRRKLAPRRDVLLLLVDEGPSPELDRLLRELGEGDMVADWARARLAAGG